MSNIHILQGILYCISSSSSVWVSNLLSLIAPELLLVRALLKLPCARKMVVRTFWYVQSLVKKKLSKKKA